MKYLQTYFSVLFFLFLSNAYAQEAASRADKLLSEAIENNEHALSVLVAKGDKILYHKTIGYANADAKILADNETAFRIGSVSKQFYASAILKLVEQGKMSLNDPLSKYIKDFPRGNEVTIHHLLTHTSGIKSYTDESDFMENVTSRVELDDLIMKIKSLGYDFDPGEKWKYNNSGYAILGYVIEEVSGMSSEKFLKKQFFVPAKMSYTGIYDNKKKYKNVALGYANEGGTVTASVDWDMTWAAAAGNIYSTASDLLAWNQHIFGSDFLSAETINKAHTPVTLNDGSTHPYGYGWGIGDYKELKMIAHSGGLHGFLSNLAYFPEIDATIVVLSNCSPPKKIVPGNFSEKLTDIFFAEHLTENEVAQTNTEEYDKYAGKYEYPGGAIMTVSKVDDRLMAQLTGQAQFEIYPKGDHVFFWKIVNAEITFHFDENGEVDYGMHKQNGFESKVPKMPERTEVSITDAEFERYIGEYSIGGVALNVWSENGAFYVQIAGQPKFQILAKSENRFFAKEMAVDIEFDNSESPAPGLIIFQAGSEVKAMRN